jgi:hypothetical protein
MTENRLKLYPSGTASLSPIGDFLETAHIETGARA